MYKTENICFPRSGHRLLQNLIRECIGDELVTGTIYGNPPASLDSEVNYLKNHDFALDTNIKPDVRYLVQIRYPLDSLISYFKLEVIISDQGDNQKAWESFAISKVEYWNKFSKRWVVDKISAPRYVCNYDDLLKTPHNELQKVIRFIGASTTEEKVEAAVEKTGVKRKNVAEDFKYYDAEFFEMLKQKLDI